MAHLLHVLALAVIFSKPTAPSQCYTTTIHAGGLPVELHPASSKSIEEQHLRNKLVTSQATFRDFSLGLESSTVCDAMPTQPGVLEGVTATCDTGVRQEGPHFDRRRLVPD